MQTVLLVLAIIVLLALAGWLFEKAAEQQNRKRYPPPGKLINVSGYRLHLQTMGERQPGQPLVVLESGDGLWSTAWRALQLDVARFARVCAYDRAGFGWSDPSPRRCSLQKMASELHTVLSNTGEKGPYLLVGHSFGGILVRQFAVQYPQEVMGVVLVDAFHENYLKYDHAARKGVPAHQRQLHLLTWLSRFGLVRLFGRRALLSHLSTIFTMSREQALFVAQAARPQYFQRLLKENQAANKAFEKGTVPPSLGEVPLVVIHARYPEKPLKGYPVKTWPQFRAAWRTLEEDLLKLSTNSQLIAFAGGHSIQNEKPEIVSEAIQRVMELSNLPPGTRIPSPVRAGAAPGVETKESVAEVLPDTVPFEDEPFEVDLEPPLPLATMMETLIAPEEAPEVQAEPGPGEEDEISHQDLAQSSGLLAQPSGPLAEPSGPLAQPSGPLAQPSGLLTEPSGPLAEPPQTIVEESQAVKIEPIEPAVAPETVEPEAPAPPNETPAGEPRRRRGRPPKLVEKEPPRPEPLPVQAEQPVLQIDALSADVKRRRGRPPHQVAKPIEQMPGLDFSASALESTPAESPDEPEEEALPEMEEPLTGSLADHEPEGADSPQETEPQPAALTQNEPPRRKRGRPPKVRLLT